jgi:hypothetical protein
MAEIQDAPRRAFLAKYISDIKVRENRRGNKKIDSPVTDMMNYPTMFICTYSVTASYYFMFPYTEVQSIKIIFQYKARIRLTTASCN